MSDSCLSGMSRAISSLLRCPFCCGALAGTDTEVRCTSCSAAFPVTGGTVSFLAAGPVDVESGYFWDYRVDPRISPLTEARWRLLTRLMDRVDVGATVVAVGGGGEHWPARQLDRRVRDYVVVDTSAAQVARQWFPRGA